jgi:hypothetical protein
VLRRIFGPKRDEVTEIGENCIMRSVTNLYSSPNIIRMIKSRRMRWAGHVAQWEEEECIWILVEKPEGKRLLARQRRRWVDDIKNELR